FFQAEDGIRDYKVTGVQTCALPICNFLGVTFLKQALYELAPDAAQLQQPSTDASFAALTAPLWIWYDQLRPLLWRHGEQFPDNEIGRASCRERACISEAAGSS